MQMIRVFSVVLLLLVAMPAMAEVTATDKIVKHFMELDTGSGLTKSVDFNEYFAMVKQRARVRFSQMDRNHDGEVTESEYRAFWKAQKAKYYRLKR